MTLPIAAIIAGGAALAGGVASGIGSASSQKSANATNMKIAQMNNEWSEKMMDKQNRYNIDQWLRESNFSAQQADKANQFTLDMWNRTNEYNSAAAQRARYQNAGLNPYMMMNGGSAGVAQGASGIQASTPSGNSVGLPSPQSVMVRPVDYSGIGRAISDAAGTFAQIQNSSAQSDYYRAQALSTLANAYEDVRNKRFQNKINEATESIQLAMSNEQYLSAVQERVNAGMTEKLMIQQEVMNNLQIANLPEQMKWDIAVKRSTVNLNDFNATSDLGKYLKTLEQKYNLKLSQKEIKAIFEAWKYTNMTQSTNSLWDLLSRGVSGLRYIGSKW